ncbi:hypothetical protein [Clostridium sp.]|uniref:hypothetical protein n=1 Tax=Clostridium sp. TaxID=1506 RepID=UPI003D6CCFF2
MDIRNKLYPYPVLSVFSDDYVGDGYIAEVKAVRDIKDIIFHLNLLMDNEELQKLIDEDMAEYIFHIECSQTSYRTVLRTKEIENIKRIPESKLNGRVAVCSFIVAKVRLENYTNSKFNPDYGNTPFNIDRGSILAIGGQTNIEITKETEELSKIPSIFSVLRRDTDDNIGMQVEIDGDKIKLWLSNEEFYNYRSASNMPMLQAILHSALILPALIYTFETVKNAGIEEYDSYRWFKAIERILKKSKIDFNTETLENIPSYEIAQKLLDLPINRALSSLLQIGTEDEEE